LRKPYQPPWLAPKLMRLMSLVSYFYPFELPVILSDWQQLFFIFIVVDN